MTTEPQENPTQPEVSFAFRPQGEVTLLDGRVATVRRAKGRDLQNALRVSQIPEEVSMVLASSVTSINGKPLYYDEFLDMDLEDCQAIVGISNALLGKSGSQA